VHIDGHNISTEDIYRCFDFDKVESCEVSECQVKALSKRLFIIYVPSVDPPMREGRT